MGKNRGARNFGFGIDGKTPSWATLREESELCGVLIILCLCDEVYVRIREGLVKEGKI